MSGADAGPAAGPSVSGMPVLDDELVENFENTDYYAFLNVARNSTEEDVRLRFRELNRVYHPDRHSSKPPHVQRAAEARAKFLNHVVDVLTDPVRRRLYDTMGEEGLKQVKQYEQFKDPDQAEAAFRADQVFQKEIEILTRSEIKVELTCALSTADWSDPEVSRQYRQYGQTRWQRMRESPLNANFYMVRTGFSVPLSMYNTLELTGTGSIVEGYGMGALKAHLRSHDVVGSRVQADLIANLGQEFSLEERFTRQVAPNVLASVGFRQRLRGGHAVALSTRQQLTENTKGHVGFVAGKAPSVEVGMSHARSRFTIRDDFTLGSALTNSLSVSYNVSRNTSLTGSVALRVAAGGRVVQPNMEVIAAHHISTISVLGFGVGMNQQGVYVKLQCVRAGYSISLPLFITAGLNLRWFGMAILVPTALFFAAKLALIDPAQRALQQAETRRKRTKYRSNILQGRARALDDMLLHEQLFQKTLAAEKSVHGLVIIAASYGDLNAPMSEQQDTEFPCVIDVTKPLQCLVNRSALLLHDGTKANLAGFYDPCPWVKEKQLRIVYELRGEEHTITAQDIDPVSIGVPS